VAEKANGWKIVITELEKRRKLGYLKCDQLFYSCEGPAMAYLFYTGLGYKIIDGIRLLPIAALWRGV